MYSCNFSPDNSQLRASNFLTRAVYVCASLAQIESVEFLLNNYTTESNASFFVSQRTEQRWDLRHLRVLKCYYPESTPMAGFLKCKELPAIGIRSPFPSSVADVLGPGLDVNFGS